MSATRNTELAEVINIGLARLSKALRVGMPGRIETFDAKTQTATVKPLLFEHFELEEGDEVNEAIDVISGVPVYFPRGGGFMLTTPVAKGDKCWLTFGDRSLDVWFERGEAVDPIDLRRHALSDAVALIGVSPKPDALTEFDNARAVFGKQGGKRIAISDTEVHLGVDHGQSATDQVALAPAVVSELNKLKDAVNALVSKFNSHMHTVSTAGSPVAHTGTTAPPSSGAQQAGSVGEVKALHVFGV